MADGTSCQEHSSIRSLPCSWGSAVSTVTKRNEMIHLGLDWADDHHDIAVMDEAGTVLAERRVSDTMVGVADIHALVADYEADASCVVVGIETTRGLVPQALVAAGYTVYEVNPLAASRYRDRHHLSGAKSDRGDAKMLADVVRTDRHNHRPYLGNTDLAESIKILARAHQELIQQRQTQVNCEHRPNPVARTGRKR